jgi:DNA repair photolyase
MEQVNAKSIFSPATGFIQRGGFEWTCNPYLGCSFGCLYCYAAFLPQNPRPVEDWGKWLVSKINAIELARKQAPRVAGKTLYLSSVTDPYLPIERSLCLTRGILEQLIPYQPRLLVQTRGPLVVRDIDLYLQFRSLRVNMSIPTDDEAVKNAFEPKAPALDRRWQALQDLQSSGIPVGVCITPMLPVRNAETFAARIAALQPTVVVTQPFHLARSGVGANTGASAIEEIQRWRWTEQDYAASVDTMRKVLTVHEAEAGFFPPPA